MIAERSDGYRGDVLSMTEGDKPHDRRGEAAPIMGHPDAKTGAYLKVRARSLWGVAA